MRNLLSTLVLVLLFVSCEKNTEIPGGEPQVTTDFRIELNEENVTPYSVQFSIYPEDKEGVFYYDIVSASRISSVDVQQIKSEIEESAQSLAEHTLWQNLQSRALSLRSFFAILLRQTLSGSYRGVLCQTVALFAPNIFCSAIIYAPTLGLSCVAECPSYCLSAPPRSLRQSD